MLFGDFNFNLLKEDDNNTRNYLDIIQNNDYSILNEVNEENYTYSESRCEYKSILDHIIKDNSLEIGEYKTEVKDITFSDHRLLVFSCNNKIKNCDTFKQVQLIDYEKVANALDTFDYTSHSYHEYIEFFKNAVSKATNIKNIRIANNTKKNWFDDEIKIELKKRKNLFDLKKKNPSNDLYLSLIHI